ncbi:serine hydrolase domain-containing protein [Salinibacillus xinjiangensis]|uniref:Serine hydrolase n=1 Tax=Salinibacillus xinjiangensis TaxID=1229268 RepID=A0A6G1X8C6_9BACI|nr:serine hydrolase [Salinibacillus xinjiangensis]MRG87197.1 serine hydrolase [Salinibacillus xinjiangensis]
MIVLSNRVNEALNAVIEKENFSGAVYIKGGDNVMYQESTGFANRSDERPNEIDTRFGIASGCKLFTAIAVCQLAEQGHFTFDSYLKDTLDIEFPYFSEDVTIHQLLCHSSGIPDYFDEEVMDDFEDLWKQNPMYHIRSLRDFLPLIQNEKMKFQPGEKFAYNNSGYIVLGLIVEQFADMQFDAYVHKYIFEPSGMEESGYFSMDRLPKNTAYGYIDEEDGTWRTNVYSLPAKGGSDGGAYTTAPDMVKLWEALASNKLLSKKYTEILLTPHIHVKEGVDYGYGVWINSKDNSIFKYHVMGYDPGVSFHSAYYPKLDITMAIPSNKGSGAFQVMKSLENELGI